MKKRWIATALAAVMAAGTLAGCSSKPEETQAPAQVEMTVDAGTVQTEAPSGTEAETEAQEYGPILSKAKESGKLVAAINAQSPPWRFHKIVDGQDKLCGFEISMCYGLADYVAGDRGGS